MKKNIRYIFLISYLVIASILVFFVFKNNDKPGVINETKNIQPIVKVEPPLNKNLVLKQEPSSEAKKISVKIIIGKKIIQPTFESGKSLYEVLLSEKNKNNLHLVGKEFSGMGFFVSEIGDLKESSTKHLIYFVNGQSPTIGISNYQLKNKDVVEWQLK